MEMPVIEPALNFYARNLCDALLEKVQHAALVMAGRSAQHIANKIYNLQMTFREFETPAEGESVQLDAVSAVLYFWPRAISCTSTLKANSYSDG